MGGAPSINPFTVPFFPFFPIIIIVTTTLIIIASAEDQDTEEKTKIPSLEDDNAADDMLLPPPVSSADKDQVVTKSVSFKPSAAAIVCVLATTFFLTFILLLYIKHCNGLAGNNTNGHGELEEMENSGIRRTVVDMLPTFKFGSLRGNKQGLECAVCLTGFDDQEILRLLPKCKHAFHMECIDTWLDVHSTCPLCRYKVEPNDIAISQEQLWTSDVECGRVMSNNINNNESLHRENENESLHSENENINIINNTESLHRENENINIIDNNESLHRENENISSRRVSFVTERKCEGSLLRGHHSRKVKSESVIGQHRLHHQIVLSPTCSNPSDRGGVHQQRSNFETNEMLYLTSDMMISCSSSSCDGRRRAVKRNRGVVDDVMKNSFGGVGGGGVRRNKRDLRSTVSEMTAMMTFFSRDKRRGRERGGGGGGREERERERERVTSRWWAWISRTPQSQRSRLSSE